jgi:hypothetical protein
VETLKAMEELKTYSDKVTIAVKAGRYEEAKGLPFGVGSHHR